MEKSDKLSFEEFISCLIKIAFKCYPSSLNKEDAMQHLLMDNILPLANKRNPIGISKTILKQPNMESMYSYYEEALMNLYIFFAITSENSEHRKNMIVSTCSTGKTFDEQAALIEESKLRYHIILMRYELLIILTQNSRISIQCQKYGIFLFYEICK